MAVAYCSAHVGFRRGCVDCRRAAKRHKASGRLVMVPAVGAQRRLRALAAVGWSLPAVAAVAGVPASTLAYVRGVAVRAQPRVVAAVARAYDSLSMVPPPAGSSSAQARRYAARQGWAPPLAWDDAALDDPSAGPVPGWERTTETPRPRSEVRVDPERVARLAGAGMSDPDIARVLGASRAAVCKCRARRGIKAGWAA